MKHLIKSLASGELMVFLDLVFTFLKWTLPLSKMENTLIHLSIWSSSVEEPTMIHMKICPTIQVKISGIIQSKSLHGFLRM